jgi:FkbM family methyltransferase
MAVQPLWEEQHIRLKRCRDGLLMYNINDSFIGRALDKYGEIFRGEAWVFSQLVRQDMTVVEVGANIGVLTVPLARFVGARGKVIAFEPQRIVYQMLCGNIALNALANVFAHHAAAGRAAGTIAVPPVDYAAPGNFGGVSLGVSTDGEIVPLVTIDQLGMSACDFIKIDVEGMELDVLLGASTTIETFRPRLYVENDRGGEKSAALIRHLLALDYRLYWHLPRLYESDNYFGDPENFFGNTVSANMICIPRSGPLSLPVNGFDEITSGDASWHAVLGSP